MLEIKNLHKYFNKNKSNEIHVINNTSLTFSDTGLVCLLGASGSGKTTLLNVIGGLDKVNSGDIRYRDYKLSRYSAKKWDYIRKNYFGYIFQNYYLLPELSVYENLRFVLKMLNLEEEEIQQRIDYALNAVGMVKYKKRKPNQLSGGQQQRIAIARALVKSPEVVIADEPTGNLDEKNTTQIMNIIKKISKECLVILVTHERRLAEFYGDRIIEVVDGKIVNDFKPKNQEILNKLDDNNIYLQEFNKQPLEADDIEVNYYFENTKEKLKLDIIFKDGTFYINAPMDNVKIKFIDKNNETKIINSKKPTLAKENIADFDYYMPPKGESINRSTFLENIKQSAKMSLKHLTNLRRRQKLLFFIFFLAAILVTIGFTTLTRSVYIDDKTFLDFNRNIVQIKSMNSKEEQLNVIKELEDDYLFTNTLFNSSFKQQHLIQLTKKIYSQANDWLYISNSSLAPIEVINKPKLVYGKMPETDQEVLIDLFLVESLLSQLVYKNGGFKYVEQFIGKTINYNLQEKNHSFTIVGIVDNNNPNIYTTYLNYKQIYANNELKSSYNFLYDINYLENYKGNKFITLEDYLNNDSNYKEVGDVVLESNQVILTKSVYDLNSLSSKDKFVQPNGVEYNIVGIITDVDTRVAYFNNNYLNDLFYAQLLRYDDYGVYSNNKKETINQLKTKNIQAIDLYQSVKSRVGKDQENISLLIFSSVVLGASLVFLFFLMRSSLISRIYEVGVYRSLGVKKLNVYLIFLTEVLIITIITAILGIGLTSLAINETNKITQVIYYPFYVPILSFIFLLIVNSIIGLLPIFSLLRKTPAEILSKYDI